MKIGRHTFNANLFYSYSHKDEQHRYDMQNALSLLKRKNLLKDWHDEEILPGQTISKEIKEKMDRADILVFLLSQDFIASDACMEEWEYAKQLAAKGKPIFRVPIILTHCSWQDLLRDDDIKALPKDGKPVSKDDKDTAWQQVYEGIKAVINQLRETFLPKSEIIREMEKTDFVAQEYVKLQDIFVFPTLSSHPPQTQDGRLRRETITDQVELLAKKHILIHGEEMSGKTALGRYLFLSLANDPSTPVLYIDLKEVSRKPNKKIFRDTYHRQFSGDYSLWKQQEDKTLILDNLSQDPNSVELILFAKDFFDKIVITSLSDIFNLFFRDEERLADFHQVQIEPLNHKQQEDLIRKRLALSDMDETITDGHVDQVENRVNSIIISNKIVPRYPFFVLSILQTYEKFMPDNFSITSYGHCYHALIVARLIKAGISHADNDINACFNFAEQLAFKIYQNSKLQTWDKSNFDEFSEEYKKIFIIPAPNLNRLKQHDYGIITQEGHFKAQYMYYFFLGRFLSKKNKKNKGIIEEMCEQNHVRSNYLTLLFVIHHTNNDEIIDYILLRTMCTLETVDPAKLNKEETDSFKELFDALPKNILSSNSVKEERKKEREIRDIIDSQAKLEDDSEELAEENQLNDIYHILKNNEIMGQILRNKYGSLEKTKIEAVIEIVADSGLRLVKLNLVDKEWITRKAHYFHKKYPDYNIETIKKIIQSLLFLRTMGNVERIVNSINVPEIKEVVNEVVRQKSTPAYDLIGYFNHLDSAKNLTPGIKQELETLLKEHDNFFFRRVLSMRTQYYMNTHRSNARIEQSICSLLGVRYSYNRLRNVT